MISWPCLSSGFYPRPEDWEHLSQGEESRESLWDPGGMGGSVRTGNFSYVLQVSSSFLAGESLREMDFLYHYLA